MSSVASPSFDRRRSAETFGQRAKNPVRIASIVHGCCLLLIVCMCSSAEAQQSSGIVTATPKANTTRPALRKVTPRGERAADATSATSSSLWTTLAALVAVIVLIFAVGKLMGRNGTPFRSRVSQEALDVLGRRTLDHRQTIHLVRCGNRILVLGSGPNGLVTLSEIDDAHEVQSLLQMCEPSVDQSSRQPGSFLSMMLGANAGSNRSTPPPERSTTRSRSQGRSGNGSGAMLSVGPVQNLLDIPGSDASSGLPAQQERRRA